MLVQATQATYAQETQVNKVEAQAAKKSQVASPLQEGANSLNLTRLEVA